MTAIQGALPSWQTRASVLRHKHMVLADPVKMVLQLLRCVVLVQQPVTPWFNVASENRAMCASSKKQQ